jgi:hypothetical protein
MPKKTLCLLALIAALLPSTVAVAQTAAKTSEEHDVEMKTRDGVTLRADIYRPTTDGDFPVLLQRTPYGKGPVADVAQKAVARGYMVVVQDVRGRGASEGEWYPFKHETDDGFDTIEWAAGLPYSNGKVGMFGGSYVGATQMLAAIGHPPHLAGICPFVTASNYHDGWVYQGGAFEQAVNESWTTALAQQTISRAVAPDNTALTDLSIFPLRQYPLFKPRSVPDSGGLTRAFAPYFLDWLDHPAYDDYWKQWSIEEHFASIQVPALTIAAWYDIFQGGALRNYAGIKAHGGSEAARNGQRLLVTIGGHAGSGRKIGEVDFGPEANKFDDTKAMLDWYDYVLQGKQNEYASGKLVRIFVMGENEWRNEDAWPLERARETHYALHSAGKANTASGDGSLSTASPQTGAPDSYLYDPANPVPTTGGQLCCDLVHLAPGPRDQRQVEQRPDVLVYSTPPLEQDLEVTGPVTLDLYAASSAVDTDFTAKLVDVGPDGFARNLTDGVLRGRYRESTSVARPIVPGRIYEYKIDMWSTSNVFLKGHTIRVEVSSSNYPRFDRNLNTGKDPGTDATVLKATNTIYHDHAHPSALILPVIPR